MENTSRREKAMTLHSEGYNCAQSVVLAFEDLLPLDKESLAKLSSSFGGGIGGFRFGGLSSDRRSSLFALFVSSRHRCGDRRGDEKDHETKI